MKKFLVLYMAKPAAFQEDDDEESSRGSEKGDGFLDKMDGRSSGVPPWTVGGASRQNQEGATPNVPRIRMRASKHGRCRSPHFFKEAPAFQMSQQLE